MFVLGPGPRSPFPLRLPTSGRVEFSLHYAYRAKGTRERLPTSDPVGDLGPMKGVPAFEIVSEPIVFEVLGPIEIVAEAKGKKKKFVLEPSASVPLLGAAGFHDEAWIAQKPIEIEISVRLDGFSPGAVSLYSRWIRIP